MSRPGFLETLACPASDVVEFFGLATVLNKGGHTGRKGFAPEFRRRALELLDAGKTVWEVAEQLGISDQSLYTWRLQRLVDEGAKDGLTSAQLEELNSARRGIKQLEAELAIHKRATEILNGSTDPKVGGRPSR